MICLNDAQFVTQIQAARIASVTRQTILTYGKRGLVETRQNDRKALYRLVDVCEQFGVPYSDQTDEIESNEKRIAIYSRVSSTQQKRDGNLKRQVERMEQFVAGKWNVEALVIQDCCSAFKSRAGLERLIDLILDEKISIVVVEHLDRWSRQSSERALLEKICRRFNVELVVVEQCIPESEWSEFAEELISYVTCLANSLNAQKQANRKRVDIDDDILERVDVMLKSGHSMKSAAEQLTRDGITGTKDRTITNQILGSRYKVWKTQQQRKAILTNGTVEVEHDAIDCWLEAKTNRGNDLKDSAKSLLESWNTYATDNGHSEANIASFARILKSKGFTNKRLGNGRMGWFGLELA